MSQHTFKVLVRLCTQAEGVNTIRQAAILYASCNGDYSMHDLSMLLNSSKPATTKAIYKLQSLGLVTCIPNTKDGRQYFVGPTSLGEIIVKRAEEI